MAQRKRLLPSIDARVRSRIRLHSGDLNQNLARTGGEAGLLHSAGRCKDTPRTVADANPDGRGWRRPGEGGE